MKLKRDQITGGVLVLLGVAVFLMTTTFSVPITLSYPGPRMLPCIAVFGFVVCGLGILAVMLFMLLPWGHGNASHFVLLPLRWCWQFPREICLKACHPILTRWELYR